MSPCKIKIDFMSKPIHMRSAADIVFIKEKMKSFNSNINVKNAQLI